MKKLLFLLLSILGLGVINAQTVYNMQNDSVTLDCSIGGVLYDSGGNTGSYGNNESFFFTVCPNSTSEVIGFDFNTANFGLGDYVCVYDGTNTSATLLECYNNANPITLNQIVRATVSNTSRCLTFQFYSDAALTGDFEIELFCLSPCQSIESVIANSMPPINPTDTTYIDLCFNDTLAITGSAIFADNDLNYHQSDLLSTFYWQVGGIKDTNIVFSKTLSQSGFYPIILTVEDTVGCRSINEHNLIVRYIPKPSFEPVFDSVICYNDVVNFYDVVSGDNIGGNVILGDTVRTPSKFSVTTAAQYIPDDADGINGNGITTPATYDVNVTGFIPGSVITSGSQVVRICLDIEHSYAGDIDILLIAPNGSQVYLVDMNPPSGPSASYGNPIFGINPLAPGTPETYCWSPTAVNVPIISGATYPTQIPPSNPVPPLNDYQAFGVWDNFIGSPVNGTWTIQVFDDFFGDDGNIFGASFEFDSLFIPPPDSFIVAYDAIGFWNPDSNILSTNLAQNTISYQANTMGDNTLYYNTTSDFGCSETDTLNFFVDGFEVAATPTDTAVCAGNPVQLNAAVTGNVMPVNYQWSPSTDLNNANIQNPIATLSSVGIEYVVGATSTNGCTFYDTANIAIEQSFTFDAMTDTTICVGDSIGLWASGGAITYAWTPNNGTINDTTIATPMVYPLSTTTYTVQADSTGCSQYANIIVNVSNIAVFTLPSVHPACGMTNGSIFMVGSGGVGPLTYSIDGGTTTAPNGFFSNLGGGIYYVVVSDGTGCDYLDTITLTGGVPLIIDTVITTEPSCGSPGSINAILTDLTLAVTYTLDVGPVSQDSSLFTGLSGGTFIVTIDDGVCPTVDTTITLTGAPALVLSINNSTDISCFNAQDGSISLGAMGGSPAYSYSIDGVSYVSSVVFSSLDTGLYTVFVQDTAGCVDSSQVTLIQPDTLVVTNIVVDSVLCNGGSASISFDAIGGYAPYQYSISNPTSFGNVNNFTAFAGNYTLQVMDSNNCVSEVSLDTVFEPVALALVLDSMHQAVCGNSVGAIFVSSTGGTSPFSYTIDGGINTQTSSSFLNLGTNVYLVEVTDANGCTATLSVTVTNTAAISISIASFDSVSCFGMTDASVQCIVLNGMAPLSFSVDGMAPQPDSLFTNLSGGMHVFTVTDANGCPATAQISIYEPAQILSTSIQDSLSCDESADGMITLTTVGGVLPHQFTLSTNPISQTNGVFNSLDAGIYDVYILDNNGCTDTLSSINIYQPDTLVITNVTTQNILCNGNTDGQFTVAVSGGTPTYTYNVNSGTNQSSNVLTNLSGGNYTINVLDNNGCIASVIDTIVEPTVISFVFDSTQNITCFNGNDGYLSCVATGGTGIFTYSIDNGLTYQASNTFNNLIAGTYIIWVKDANGCTTNQSITLSQANEILYTATATTVSCAGLADAIINITGIMGGTSPYSISLNGAMPISIVGTNYDFTNIAGGQNHTIQITDVNGCSSVMSTLSVVEPDSLKLTGLTTTAVTCFGADDGIISIDATNGTPSYTFNLNSNGTLITSNIGNTALFNNLSGGFYPIYLEDSNGCSDTMIVEMAEPAALVIDSMVILSQISCFGEDNASIIVYPSGGSPLASLSDPYYFLWSPSGDIAHKTGGIAPGIHTVTVTDANGCTVTASETIDAVDPIIATINPDSAYISMGDTLQLGVNVLNTNGALQYSWTPTNGLSCSDCANPVVTIFNDITYSVLVTDSNGCTNYNYTEVFIGVNPTLFLFIPNGFSPDGDGINDVFAIEGQDIKTVSMMIFNRWGEKVFEGNNQYQSWDGTVNGEIQGGVYSYAIDITFLNDAKINKKGSVTLLK